MSNGKSESREKTSNKGIQRTVLRISSTDDHSTSVARRTTGERSSVFSWKDDSCWSVSENTKSKDFRRKRFKKQKGEYLAAKDPRPEELKELLNTPDEEEEKQVERESLRGEDQDKN